MQTNSLAISAEHDQVRPARRPAQTTAGAVAVVVVVGLLALAGLLWSPAALAYLQEALGLVLFAVATNLLLGYGGLVSFAQAAFYGIGAYGIAIGWLHWKLPFWLGAVAGIAAAAAAAVIVGGISLRTRRLYFALLTLAFTQLFFVIADNQTGLTNGATGIFGAMVPTWLAEPRGGYYFTLAVVVVVTLACYAIAVSPFGLTLKAVRENRERAEALGVNVFRHQLAAFVISAVGCAIAGCLFAIYSQSASPDLLSWTNSGEPIFMAVLGGMNTFFGPVAGAIVYFYAHLYLTEHVSDWQLVLGLLLLVIVLFKPAGLAGIGADAGRAVSRLRLRRGGRA
jgi:branched-chain amino acid transport system permease protein